MHNALTPSATTLGRIWGNEPGHPAWVCRQLNPMARPRTR
jgi:hypothetical protein